MKKSPVPIEKGRRIKKRRVMAESQERVRGLFDELFDKFGEIILDGRRMKRTTDLTCEEAKEVLDRDYPRVNTKRKAAAFERLQDYFHKKFGDAIPLRPVPEGLGNRPTVLNRMYRIPK